MDDISDGVGINTNVGGRESEVGDALATREAVYLGDVVDERWSQEIPVFGQPCAAKGFLSRYLHCQLEAVVVVVHIVLPSAVDDVPVATSDDTRGSDVVEMVYTVDAAGVYEACADFTPPGSLRMRVL